MTKGGAKEDEVCKGRRGVQRKTRGQDDVGVRRMTIEWAKEEGNVARRKRREKYRGYCTCEKQAAFMTDPVTDSE